MRTDETTYVLNYGLATVWWTGRDLALKVRVKEERCREPDHRTRPNFAARPSGWCALRRRINPYRKWLGGWASPPRNCATNWVKQDEEIDASERRSEER